MKKISFYALMLALSFMTFVSCGNTPEPNPTPEPDPTEGMHFDIWTPVGGNAGAGQVDCIVKRTTSLESGELDFKGSGVDLSQKLYPTTIVKGKYYYFVSKDARLGKYQITENGIVTVKEIPFPTLKERRHSQTWINDNTLLLVGSNGESDKIVWAKINTETMTVAAEGELNLPEPPKGQVYNTSGMVAYRKSDNKVIYFFKYNKAGGTAGTEPKPEFYASFINASDMSTLKTVTETRADQMASTAYGELRQEKSFFDENGDYYIACNNVLPDEGTTTAQSGALLRIKKDADEFDKTYNAYTRERGKIVTSTYLNNGKALLYMQDPMYTTGNKVWNSTSNPYVYYWLIVDLKTLAVTDLKDIPFCNGNYSQLSLAAGKKAYFGVNPKEGKSSVYVYDISTEKITKGLTLAEGFLIDRIVWVED